MQKFDYRAALKAVALAAFICLMAIALTRLSEENTQSDYAPIEISEVMAYNTGAWAKNGEYMDWVEIQNASDAAISLDGYSISTGSDLRGAHALSGTLGAGERILVYCSEVYADADIDAGIDRGGDLIAIICKNGRIVGSVVTPAMACDESYALMPDGQWALTEDFTPGMANTPENHARLICPEETGPVVITEVMVNEVTGDGEKDWIELFNAGGSDITLDGWHFTDDSSDMTAMEISNLTILAGDYAVVYMNGIVNLSPRGEKIWLTDASGVVSSWADYGEVSGGRSASLTDGVFTTDLLPTPGMANTPSSVRLLYAGGDDPITFNELNVYINEICASSSKYCDWVEIYNASDAEVDLSGWGLSDDKTSPGKWRFPEGAYLAAGGYAVVCLKSDKEISEVAGAYYSTDFAISVMGGETVTLSLPGGDIVDMVAANGLSRDISLGRAEGQAAYRYFSKTTPGAVNADTSYRKKALTPEFSVNGVMMDSAFTLEISSDERASIFYTTDGTQPVRTSKVYTGPIIVDSSMVIRAVAAGEDMITSERTAHTYIVGDSTNLRVVAVSGNPEDLTTSGGVLTTGFKQNKRVWVEIYDYDGTLMVSQETRLRTSGEGSRITNAQKAFTLSSDKGMGVGKFKSRLFRNLDYEEYDSITLRASGQDTAQTHMRDSILTSLAGGTSVLYQETEVCAVYVNGEYWGVYNMRENINADYICRHEEVSEDTEVYMLEGDFNQLGGAALEYRELMKKIADGGLKSDSAVEALNQYIDTDNYLEYVAVQMFIANLDLRNLRIYRTEGGKWKYLVYDTDLSFQIDKNTAAMWLSGGYVGTITPQDATLFAELMKNAAQRDKFLTLMGRLLATTFSSESVVGAIYERCALIEDDMDKQCARWSVTEAHWQKCVLNFIEYAEKRPKKMIGYLTEAFDLSDAEAQAYFGEAVQAAKDYVRPSKKEFVK